MKYTHIVFDLFGTLISLDEAKEKGKILKESIPQEIYSIFLEEWDRWHISNYPIETF